MARTLTDEERAAAIKAAERYPAGFGDKWLAVPNMADTGNVLAYLHSHPEAIERGCPAVAVAAVRGEITSNGLTDALGDVYRAAGFESCLEYNELLGRRPESVAQRLKKSVEQCQAD